MTRKKNGGQWNPICDAPFVIPCSVNSLMNQIEAMTVLQKRHRLLQPLLQSENPDQNPDQVLDEIVLFSRKRQAQIAFRLQRRLDCPLRARM